MHLTRYVVSIEMSTSSRTLTLNFTEYEEPPHERTSLALIQKHSQLHPARLQTILGHERKLDILSLKWGEIMLLTWSNQRGMEIQRTFHAVEQI